MEMIIVILIVTAALLCFIWSFAKKAKENGGCGCSCGLADTECKTREKGGTRERLSHDQHKSI